MFIRRGRAESGGAEAERRKKCNTAFLAGDILVRHLVAVIMLRGPLQGCSYPTSDYNSLLNENVVGVLKELRYSGCGTILGPR